MRLRIDLLKYKAYQNLTATIDTPAAFEAFLIRWWSRKYKLPDNDPRLLAKTVEELAVEYYEDYFLENPQELQAYEQGYRNSGDMDKEWLQKEMGEEYHDDLDYLEAPPAAVAKTEESEENIEESFDVSYLGE